MTSKAYWGYDEGFLEACRAELALSGEEIAASTVIVAEEEGRVRGFARLAGTPPRGELTHLFIDPEAIGLGIGRRLFSEIQARAVSRGFTAIVIDSEPAAAGFYRAMGAREAGRVPSGSIPGRELPRLTYAVAGANDLPQQ
jgi:GNAT superfamily N-acetyltransferase